MPFRNRVRAEFSNRSGREVHLFFQIDYTLEPEIPADAGYLHVSFRRENPTTLGRDFVIHEGLVGPGRFLGCNVGIRILDGGIWYGEGEVKFYRDGDTDYPTICGTGLEDYVGSAWGMGPHNAWYAGSPLRVPSPDGGPNPAFVGFYRWHLPDPIVFTQDLRVTIQQIGYGLFGADREKEFEEFRRQHPAAGTGWEHDPAPGVLARGIFERIDDYCATPYVYCRVPQSVPRVEVEAATANVGRLPHEEVSPLEQMMGGVSPGE
jgi:hypothetical protein